MKFFVAFAALVVLAVATPVQKHTISSDAELQQILESIYHPSTDPATAELLLDMLYEQLGLQKPVIGPAFIDLEDNHVPDVSPAEIVAPKPKGPLVQIIVNVNANGVSAAAADNLAPVKPDEVQIAESEVDVSEIEVSEVIVADLPAPPISEVVVADLPAPPAPVNLPEELN